MTAVMVETKAPAPERVGDRDIALLAKALGHPSRVRILRLLLAREACFCGEIVAELPLAQATVSQHLKVLKQAGLIQGEIDGPHVCYCANARRLAEFHDLVGRLLEDSAEQAGDRGGCD